MKTPRTNARLVKYRDGSLAAFFKRRICYADFARELEVETQELVAALQSAVKWLIMIDERRSDVPQWLRHDADPRPLRMKIQKLLKDASAETATPAPHPDAAFKARLTRHHANQ